MAVGGPHFLPPRKNGVETLSQTSTKEKVRDRGWGGVSSRQVVTYPALKVFEQKQI